MVPEGWKKRRLSDLANVTSGGTPSRSKPEYWNGDIPWVTTAEIYKKTITDTAEKLTIDGLENSSAKVFPPGAILLAMYGQGRTRGQVAMLGIEAATNQACAAILPKENVSGEYIYQNLLSRYEEIRRLANDGSQKNLSGELIKNISILQPPRNEQEQIATILTAWDHAIDKVEALIANSENAKRTLMRRLLTGDQRFPDFVGKPWQVAALKKFCKVRRGASPRPIDDPKWFAEHGRGWVRISDVTSSQTEHLQSTEQYLSNLGVEKSVAVDPGELIMSICATIGVPKIVGIPVCIHDGFVVFRDVNPSLDLNFLHYVLEFKTRQLANSGQPGTQKNLNTSIVGNIQIPAVAKAEQQVIVAALKAADQRTRLERTFLEGLRLQKAALAEQLLTGKRRVKAKDNATPVAVYG